MAGELQLSTLSGKTVYFVLRNSNGLVWNTNTLAFEAYNVVNYANYVIAATEEGSSGFYIGNFPAVAAGVYSIIGLQQVSGSPAQTDFTVAGGTEQWNGTAIVPLFGGPKLAATGLDGILVAGFTLPNALKYIGATTAAKLPNGAGTGQENWLDFQGNPALDITVDANGNRTAITYH